MVLRMSCYLHVEQMQLKVKDGNCEWQYFELDVEMSHDFVCFQISPYIRWEVFPPAAGQ